MLILPAWPAGMPVAKAVDRARSHIRLSYALCSHLSTTQPSPHGWPSLGNATQIELCVQFGPEPPQYADEEQSSDALHGNST